MENTYSRFACAQYTAESALFPEHFLLTFLDRRTFGNIPNHQASVFPLFCCLFKRLQQVKSNCRSGSCEESYTRSNSATRAEIQAGLLVPRQVTWPTRTSNTLGSQSWFRFCSNLHRYFSLRAVILSFLHR
jgi:hypothetical protein